MDGASRQTGAGVGLQLKTPTRERVEQAIRQDVPMSNNETECGPYPIHGPTRLAFKWKENVG